MNPQRYSQVYYDEQFLLQHLYNLLYERKSNWENCLLNKILEEVLYLNCQRLVRLD